MARLFEFAIADTLQAFCQSINLFRLDTQLNERLQIAFLSSRHRFFVPGIVIGLRNIAHEFFIDKRSWALLKLRLRRDQCCRLTTQLLEQDATHSSEIVSSI